MAKRTRLADRIHAIEPFHVMDLLADARVLESAGHSIMHMEIGEPDFTTPAPVVNAGKRALREGKTHYTPALGLPALRESIAAYYQTHYATRIDPNRIVVTPGASGALQLITSILVNPGDEVVMADPGYPCNRHFVRLAGGRAVSLPVGSDTAYHLTRDQVAPAMTAQTVAILVASPSNPTGTLLAHDTIEALAALADDHDARLIVDEIYHGLVYTEPPPTAASISEDIFVVNSFSKYFGMTGWRLGWTIVPADVVDAMDKLAQNIFLAPSTLAQYAALQAFTAETLEILDQRREAFRARRDFLLPALRNLGFDIQVEPEGAFYLYADCSAFTEDSYGFVRRALEEAHVAMTPGIDFGEHLARQHVRFAYTTELEKLEEGVERLARWLP